MVLLPLAHSPDTDPPARARDPEAAALAALDSGDIRGALATLVAAYRDPLYGFCREMMRDAALADDALQTTFVQAYRDLPRFESRGSSLRAWLYSIARNRCLDALKSERRRRARFEVIDGDGDADPAPSAVRRLADRELGVALDHCLGQLAPHIRTAVLLRYQEGFSYQELADVARERPATLQARVARALPVLRQCIEERMGGQL